jgi:DNA-binding CsgD family transcriptional regulator
MARPAQRPGNLPTAATSFVGRRRELGEVRKKLTEARLVSLVGPGGVGKTRLAIRAAAELNRGFRGGGWLVELAEVLDPALVSHGVLAALGLRDQAAAEPLPLLLSYLRDKELLLVMDNCEHVLESAANIMPFLAPLLADARQAAVTALGAGRFEAAFRAGQRLDRTVALRLVLGELGAGEGGAGEAGAGDEAGAGPLAKRETDVARLVAEGLTNRQIATRLFISERTVDSHVRSILNKLGVNSRAQIAAWMASADH